MSKKILYLSPSSLNLYSICPLLYKHKKDAPKERTSFLNFGSWIHRVNELYLRSDKKRDIFQIAKSTFAEHNIGLDDFLTGKHILEKFLKREYLEHKILGIEIKLEDIMPNGIALKGIADLIVERDRDTIEIIDYKSGWKYYTVANLNYDAQLKIYENIIRAHKDYKKYPNVILTIDPLRYDPISVMQSEVDNESFLDWLEQMYLKITKDKKFKPNFPNSFCKTCQVTNLCPKYKELLKYDFKLRKKMEDRVQHFYELRKIKPIIENDIEFYKSVFKDCITAAKEETVEVGKFILGMNQNKRLFVKRKH
jgi:RecB family exonuclease